MSAPQMIEDLVRDGLLDNEIAAMIGVSEQTLVNWRRGTKPQAAKLTRLEDLHSIRDLRARSRR